MTAAAALETVTAAALDAEIVAENLRGGTDPSREFLLEQAAALRAAAERLEAAAAAPRTCTCYCETCWMLRDRCGCTGGPTGVAASDCPQHGWAVATATE